MKKVFLMGLFLSIPLISMGKQQYVQGYQKHDGTYVDGYYRSQPDEYRYNNNSYNADREPMYNKSHYRY